MLHNPDVEQFSNFNCCYGTHCAILWLHQLCGAVPSRNTAHSDKQPTIANRRNNTVSENSPIPVLKAEHALVCICFSSPCGWLLHKFTLHVSIWLITHPVLQNPDVKQFSNFHCCYGTHCAILWLHQLCGAVPSRNTAHSDKQPTIANRRNNTVSENSPIPVLKAEHALVCICFSSPCGWLLHKFTLHVSIAVQWYSFSFSYANAHYVYMWFFHLGLSHVNMALPLTR